ncbi:hypothetical protein PtB15_13B303 [Puccinia triticina]|nr:hypothetical protein PtB15_13B303 [Puccinia triticina]
MHLSLATLRHILAFCIFVLPAKHGLVAVASMSSASFVLVLLYICRTIIYSKKAAEAEKRKVDCLPPDYFPQVEFRRGSRNLGIFDSLITFGQFGSNDLELTDYELLAEMYSSPKFSAAIKPRLVTIIRRTGQVVRSLNEHLDELAIHGFNTMLVFVFEQEKENIHSSTAALINGEAGDQPTVLNRTQTSLRHLAWMIHVTRLLAESAVDHHQDMIKSLNENIESIGRQTETKIESKQQLLAELHKSVALGLLANSCLERWRRQLKIYAGNVRLTQEIHDSGGERCSYVKDAVVNALDALLKSKKTSGGPLGSIRENQNNNQL